MKCPRCVSAEMSAQQAASIEIDRCPICRGYWLDALELESLLNAHPRDLFAADKPGAAAAPAGNLPPARMQCPRCGGGQLIRMSSLQRAGTIVDSCTVCYGVWLDAGELARLAHADVSSWIASMQAKF